jgi:hypothetical protein
MQVLSVTWTQGMIANCMPVDLLLIDCCCWLVVDRMSLALRIVSLYIVAGSRVTETVGVLYPDLCMIVLVCLCINDGTCMLTVSFPAVRIPALL